MQIVNCPLIQLIPLSKIVSIYQPLPLVYLLNLTSRSPFSGYGPGPDPPKPEIDIDIDIENDLNIPDLENPNEDIDLGDGQVVNRPQDLVRICDNAARKGSDAAAHPTDCER